MIDYCYFKAAEIRALDVSEKQFELSGMIYEMCLGSKISDLNEKQKVCVK